MIPSYFIQLDSMPVTPSGKVNRRALPEPELKDDDNYVAPSNETEWELARIWSETLGIDENTISVNENFFKLGGHSLKATTMVSLIHKELSVKIPLTEVFRGPTIRELALRIGSAAADEYSAVEPVEKHDWYPQSSAQKRLYIIQRMDLSSTVYNMPGFIPLTQKPDVARLENAFRKLIQRHESLRTSFFMLGDVPVQKIHETVEFQMETDPSILPFDLSRPPLLRVATEEKENNGQVSYTLMVDMHHIIADGLSMEVLHHDLIALYQGEALPPLRIQYKDFAQWQNSASRVQFIGKQESYWKKRFAGDVPILQLPIDFPRPMERSFEGAVLRFPFSDQEAEGLKTAALKTGASLYMTLLALTAALLYRLSGQEDIVVGTPIAGRRHADLEKIIGMFVNTLALRNYPEPDKSFNAFIEEVKTNTLQDFENQEYPFEELVETLDINRDVGRNPLFDFMFSLMELKESSSDYVDKPAGEDAETGADTADHRWRIAKFDLSLDIEVARTMTFTIQYCTALFTDETIRRFARYFKTLAVAATSNMDACINDVELLSEGEKKQLLEDFNDTRSDFSNEKTVHRLFEEQVANSPDRVAVEFEDQQVTYAELKQPRQSSGV